MSNDFAIHSFFYKKVEFYCNLVKGDANHSLDQYIKYTLDGFSFIDYGYVGGVVNEPLLDYTEMDEATLFQESLVFDKKYICTLDEVIGIQNIMKEYSAKCMMELTQYKHKTIQYYFNL